MTDATTTTRETGRHRRHAAGIQWLLLAAGLYAGGLLASADILDAAVKRYYAGYPEQAIAMLEPLAIDGDVDARYLLGNILYTLSQAQQTQDDPLKWYHLAAEQGSAPASFALGTIYQNRWLDSRLDEDAERARAHFQQALDLGEAKAQAALTKLAAHRRAAAKSSSLTYTNESFSSTRQPVAKSAPASRQATADAARRTTKPATSRDELTEALANFQSSGDLLADAQRLQKLLSKYQGGIPSGVDGQDGESSISALTQLLGGFESTEELISDIAKLYDHIKAATELSTAPGAN